MKPRPRPVDYDSGSFRSMVEHAQEHARVHDHEIEVDDQTARVKCWTCLQEWFVTSSASHRYEFLLKPGKPF